MNLDFDTIEIPEEKLNRTIQNNIKKVHGIHRKQMIRHTALRLRLWRLLLLLFSSA